MPLATVGQKPSDSTQGIADYAAILSALTKRVSAREGLH